jgi:TPP-dependent 2-oxoacid decarboxylase
VTFLSCVGIKIIAHGVDRRNMGRYGANPIILVLNNDGYMAERALEPYPDWSYNDLAKWRYADLPRA